MKRITQLEARTQGARQDAVACSARSGNARGCTTCRSPATPTRASRRCSTRSPTPACTPRTVCSPPSTPAPDVSRCPAARRSSCRDTVGFIRKLPHQLVEAFRSTLEVVLESELVLHVVDASAPNPEAQMATVREVLGEIDAGEIDELLVFNKADLNPDEAERLVRAHPGSVRRLGRRPARASSELLEALGERLRAQRSVVELEIPFARGDVLAAVHREGEVLEEDARRPRHARAGARRRRRRGTLRELGRRLRDHAQPFVPPVYPYDRLNDAKAAADAFPGGIVDLSIGTPCDPPPQRRARRARVEQHRARLPAVGRLAGAARGGRRVDGPAPRRIDRRGAASRRAWAPRSSSAPCRSGWRCATRTATPSCIPSWRIPPTRWAPRSRAAGPCRYRSTPTSRCASMRSSEADAARALCLWVNTPGNPAGQLDDLGAAAAWGRAHGVPVFSDECYVEFTWEEPKRSDPASRHRRRRRGALAFEAVEPRRPTGRFLRR